MAIYLVRHGKAGSRHDWKGSDEQRPLSKRGRRQADALVNLLADRGIVRVFSSPSVRCVQTVEPLASKLGLTVDLRSELGEGTARADVAGFVGGLFSTTAAVCSHGDMIPIILEILAADRGLDLPDDQPCAKGSVWELAEDGPDRMTAKYLPPPK